MTPVSEQRRSWQIHDNHEWKKIHHCRIACSYSIYLRGAKKLSVIFKLAVCWWAPLPRAQCNHWENMCVYVCVCTSLVCLRVCTHHLWACVCVVRLLCPDGSREGGGNPIAGPPMGSTGDPPFISAWRSLLVAWFYMYHQKLQTSSEWKMVWTFWQLRLTGFSRSLVSIFPCDRQTWADRAIGQEDFKNFLTDLETHRGVEGPSVSFSELSVEVHWERRFLVDETAHPARLLHLPVHEGEALRLGQLAREVGGREESAAGAEQPRQPACSAVLFVRDSAGKITWQVSESEASLAPGSKWHLESPVRVSSSKL